MKHFIKIRTLSVYSFIILTFSIIFTSCLSIKDVSVQGIEQFKVKKISKEGMQTEITVKIKNPNNFGFYIYSGKADVQFMNLPLGTATLMKKIYIPANSSESYNLLLNTTFDKITMQDILNTLYQPNSFRLKIHGHIKAGKFLLRKKIPTNYEGNPLSLNF
ncbi:MAG: hypothetical protein KatS3mg027_0635 [Bacteroidia bacterium]|nr:MAG: hypothetical protein KatS3mg027_0635 [Bacteroidia bacterium]